MRDVQFLSKGGDQRGARLSGQVTRGMAGTWGQEAGRGAASTAWGGGEQGGRVQGSFGALAAEAMPAPSPGLARPSAQHTSLLGLDAQPCWPHPSWGLDPSLGSETTSPRPPPSAPTWLLSLPRCLLHQGLSYAILTPFVTKP